MMDNMSWDCYVCGTTNSMFRDYCKNCGKHCSEIEG